MRVRQPSPAPEAVEQLQTELQQAKDRLNKTQTTVNRLTNRRLNQIEQELNRQQQTLQQLADQLPQQQAERIREWRLFEVKQTLAAVPLSDF